MKRFLILIALFLIAGSITAVGYALFQIGMIGKTENQAVAQNVATSTNEGSAASKKDLSWMQEIKGLSESTSTPSEKETLATSTEDGLNAASTSSTSDTNDSSSSTKDGTNASQTSNHDPVITDLGKSDALTSTVYDYAFKALVLSADIRHGTVFLTWTPATNDSFISYKVLRSTTDENPYYSKNSAVKTIPDVTETAYTDAKVTEGKTYYYRICMTKKDKPPACGNIIQIQF